MQRNQSIGKSQEALEKVYGKRIVMPSRVMETKNGKPSDAEQFKESSISSSDESQSSSSISTITISSESSSVIFCSSTSGRTSNPCPTTTKSGRNIMNQSSSSGCNKVSTIDSTGLENNPANLKKGQKLRLRDPVSYSDEEYYDSIGIPRSGFKGRHRRRKRTMSANKLRVTGNKGLPVQVTDLRLENQSKCLHGLGLKLKQKLSGVGRNTNSMPQILEKEVRGTMDTWPKLEYWDALLQDPSNRKCIAPVNLFQNAPFADVWKQYATTSLVIEVPNPYVNLKSHRMAYWIGSITEFSGYRALVQLESFDVVPSRTIWIPFCSSVPQHLGFADKTGRFLHPALDVAKVYPKYIEKARQVLINLGENVDTLQANNAEFVSQKVASGQRYQLGTKLEVVDISAVHRNQIGTVTVLVGDRIAVAYDVPKRDAKYNYGTFLNVKSPFVHPLGWSQLVGHELYAPANFANQKQISPDEVEDPLFIHSDRIIRIKEGMALEIRSNLPYKIVPAVVSKVLKFGYFMAEFKPKDKKQQFKMCFHIDSPYVLPCGFCLQHGIEILPSLSEHECEDSTSDCGNCPVQHRHLYVSQLPRAITHSFKEGMKLEAVDLMQPHLICPATIVKIAGHLLKLQFDGRPKEKEESFQWVSVGSHDIYPLGWAEMVGHRFAGCPVPCMNNSKGKFPDPQIASGRKETNSVFRAPPESEEDVAAYAESLIGSLELSECGLDVQTADQNWLD